MTERLRRQREIAVVRVPVVVTLPVGRNRSVARVPFFRTVRARGVLRTCQPRSRRQYETTAGRGAEKSAFRRFCSRRRTAAPSSAAGCCLFTASVNGSQVLARPPGQTCG